MDYDESDFEIQNCQLAVEEGSTKLPAVLRPYALPKFDFDDSLQEHLRFDNLVETEVFLGIESQEDNRWIDDFSQASGGIEFTSSATESCPISRNTNVWSEATSSESVEMLLKSVGQEEMIPGHNFKESVDFDNLDSSTKLIVSSPKQDDDILSSVKDVIDSGPMLSPVKLLESVSRLDKDSEGMTQVVEISLAQEGESSDLCNPSETDLVAAGETSDFPVIERDQMKDGNFKDENQRGVDSLCNEILLKRSLEDPSATNVHNDNLVISMQISCTRIKESNTEEVTCYTSAANEGFIEITHDERLSTHMEEVIHYEAFIDNQHDGKGELSSLGEKAQIDDQNMPRCALTSDTNCVVKSPSVAFEIEFLAEKNSVETSLPITALENHTDTKMQINNLAISMEACTRIEVSNTEEVIQYTDNASEAIVDNDNKGELSAMGKEAQIDNQNMHGGAFKSATDCAEKPLSVVFQMESFAEENTVKNSLLNVDSSSTMIVEERSNMEIVEGRSDMEIVEGTSNMEIVEGTSNMEIVEGSLAQDSKCEDIGLLESTNNHDSSLGVMEGDSSREVHTVETTVFDADVSQTECLGEEDLVEASLLKAEPSFSMIAEVNSDMETVEGGLAQDSKYKTMGLTEDTNKHNSFPGVSEGDSNCEVHAIETVDEKSYPDARMDMEKRSYMQEKKGPGSDCKGTDFLEENSKQMGGVIPTSKPEASLLFVVSSKSFESPSEQIRPSDNCDTSSSKAVSSSSELEAHTSSSTLVAGTSDAKRVEGGLAQDSKCRVINLMEDSNICSHFNGSNHDSSPGVLEVDSNCEVDAVETDNTKTDTDANGHVHNGQGTVCDVLEESGKQICGESSSSKPEASLLVVEGSKSFEGLLEQISHCDNLNTSSSKVVSSSAGLEAKGDASLKDVSDTFGFFEGLAGEGHGSSSHLGKFKSCDKNLVIEHDVNNSEQGYGAVEDMVVDCKGEGTKAVNGCAPDIVLKNPEFSSNVTMDGGLMFSGNVDTSFKVSDHDEHAKLTSLVGEQTYRDNMEEIASESSVEASKIILIECSPVLSKPGLVAESGHDVCHDTTGAHNIEQLEQSPTAEKCISTNMNEHQEALVDEVDRGCSNEPESSTVPCDSTLRDDVAVVALKSGEVTATEIFHGASTNVVDKPTCGSPSVIKSAEISLPVKDIQAVVKGSLEQNVTLKDGILPLSGESKKVCSDSLNINDKFSKDQGFFSFDLSSLRDLDNKDAGMGQFQSSPMQASKLTLNAEKSPSVPGLGHASSMKAHKISPGPQGASGEIVFGCGRGTPERKTRRASVKAVGKESAKKGNLAKGANPVKLFEQVDSSSIVSPGPSFYQHESEGKLDTGHMGQSSKKPTNVFPTPASVLPDLNTSASLLAIFQQPFMDIQQLQLRAQIFVYGSLIQGATPDEAHMESAFGGLDGGRSIWEQVWRLSVERLRDQKSNSSNPETPLHPHSGARAPTHASRHGALQTKMIYSPVGLTSNKSTPSPIVNSVIPLSSPLWSISTPLSDTLNSSTISRSTVKDPNQAPTPLHPFLSPAIRSFGGQTWVSQPPFSSQRVTSPQPPAFDTSFRLSTLRMTEPVTLTPVMELSRPPHGSLNTIVHSGGPTSYSGTPVITDITKSTFSAGQESSNPKSRKRRKSPVSEDLGHISLPRQIQTYPVAVSGVSSHFSTPIVSVTPAVSKISEDELFPTASTTSSDLVKVGNIMSKEQTAVLSEGTLNNVKEAKLQAVLSEGTLNNVKEAKMQAETAATHAKAAVGHSQLIWDQLDKQKNSGLISDGEAKLASASVAIAAAASVAKAAAAAAKVAAYAAMQAKMMAEEVMNILGDAPASIMVQAGADSSGSIINAAREASRRRVEAASAASKQAENLDAIVKAAELAAEAVTQAGIVVAMGNPLSLSELIKSGPDGYWRVPQVASDPAVKLNDSERERSNTESIELSPKSSGKGVEGVTMENRETQAVSDVNPLTPKEISLVTAVTVEGTGFKEGSLVEVFKDGDGSKAAWYLASVMSLKDGEACLCYTQIPSGSGQLKEWVPLSVEGDQAPRIRVPHPMTTIQFEGAKKRRRAAMSNYNWSIGDKVDAFIQDCWWEGVVTEKDNKDETILTVHFPAHGEKSILKAWQLRPSVLWKDGQWIECSNSRETNLGSHEGDTPREKRVKIGSPVTKAEKKENVSTNTGVVESSVPEATKLLDLGANEKTFNIGKNIRDDGKKEAFRTLRSGLQKEGSRVIFGVPKPGKKRKFMDVSKHYVSDNSIKASGSNDSVKFGKNQMAQGSVLRGWRSGKFDSRENQVTETKPRVFKTGKGPSLSRTIPSSLNDSDTENLNASRKQGRTDLGSSNREGTSDGPLLFSSFRVPQHAVSSKKVSTSDPNGEQSRKGRLAPTSGKLAKIQEDKVYSGSNVRKPASDVVEPRRSNRMMQPTSRLLEGLQSSLSMSKIPSALQDRGAKFHNKSAAFSRGKKE